MEELSEAFSEVMEFLPTYDSERRRVLVDSCVATDPLPPSKSASIQTHHKCNAETQTVVTMTIAPLSAMDERKLAAWLREICPRVEAELDAPTPLLDTDEKLLDLKVEPYQKLTLPAGEYIYGVATWLSVHTNDAPVLVVTAVPAGADDWNEAVNQSLIVYQPKRANVGNYVVYTEVANVPVKVVKSLCTNRYNKTIFAGSTVDGDIYVWQYEYKQNVASNDDNVSIRELYCVNSPQGWAVALDWATEHCVLTAHASGWIIQWQMGQQQQPEMRSDWRYQLKPTINTSVAAGGNEITTMVCLSINEFVVGTQEGDVYHCWSVASVSGGGGKMPQFEIVALRKHDFMIATLLKTSLAGAADCVLVISCDLSGVVYYHDLRHADDDVDNNRRANVIAQIPLPFKNALACTLDALVLYAPGNDGALDCYRIQDGQHTSVKGALRGKGNFIKRSDNGHWLITGLYEDEFQIFYVEANA